MRKAIKQNPNESAERIIISGGWYVPYTPHFYLAVALAESNRCEEARSELAASEAQGFIQKFEAVTLKKTHIKCPTPPPVIVTASAGPPPTEPGSPGPIGVTGTGTIGTTSTGTTTATQQPPVGSTGSTGSTTSPSRPQPPLNLAEAVRAYARGEYPRALSLLASSSTNDRVYKAQVALLRGASRYSQFLAAGGTNTSLKKQIVADIRAYRDLDNRPLDPRLFSPRFRDFVSNPR